MKGILLLAMAYLRHNRWLLLMLLLWPWLFSIVLSFGGENQIGDYSAILQQESFYGIVIIGFMATAALNNEQKSRRIIAVLSKAVSRGKYLASFLFAVFLVAFGFVLNVGIATQIATLHMHVNVSHLPIFLAAVLLIAVWVASLSLMLSTFLPPLPTTILTGIGLGLPLLAMRSAGQSWTALTPTLPIFVALAGNPLSASWKLSWLPLAGATVEIFIFLAIGAWTFQYRDLTRVLE